jgi:TPR repeat protein
MQSLGGPGARRCAGRSSIRAMRSLKLVDCLAVFGIVAAVANCNRTSGATPASEPPSAPQPVTTVAPAANSDAPAASSGSGAGQAVSPEIAASRADCDKGNFKSCARVGWAHYTGEGAPLDRKTAHGLFKHACDQGEEKGCVPLGYMYQTGDVVAKDLEKAIAIFKPVCERGAFKVCIGLGELYEKEKSDPAAALVWFRKACEGGESAGCEAEQRVKGQ